MSEIRQVQIRFVETDATHGVYSDALYFPLEGFESITQAEIDAQKQARLTSWVEAIEAPKPEPVEKTKEELEFEKLEMVALIDELQKRVVEVEAKIVEADSKVVDEVIDVEVVK